MLYHCVTLRSSRQFCSSDLRNNLNFSQVFRGITLVVRTPYGCCIKHRYHVVNPRDAHAQMQSLPSHSYVDRNLKQQPDQLPKPQFSSYAVHTVQTSLLRHANLSAHTKVASYRAHSTLVNISQTYSFQSFNRLFYNVDLHNVSCAVDHFLNTICHPFLRVTSY